MKYIAALAAMLALTVGARGQVEVQPPVVEVIGPPAIVLERTATIGLNYPSSVLFIAPVLPRAPITIAAGTKLKLNAPDPGSTHGPVQWFKDGKSISGSGATLEIVTDGASGSGNYSAIVKQSDGRSSSSDWAAILVTSREGQRLINMSSRTRIGPEQPILISGFVVEAGPSGAGTLVLVRGVGRSLEAFGVTGVLAAPVVKLYDNSGQVINPVGPSYAAVPTPVELANRVGAFPLIDGGKDFAQLYRLPAGAFTAHLSSGDGGSGAALLEIFEVSF